MTPRWSAVPAIALSLACLVTGGVARAQASEPATRRVSVGAGGAEADGGSYGCALSGDGRFAAYISNATNLVANDGNDASDVLLFDLEASTTRLASVRSGGTQANGPSGSPSLSHSGRYTAFTSSATNLVRGDRNGASDVFVYDRREEETTRVSVRSDLGEANGANWDPAISANGRFVAFTSTATNLAVKGDRNGTSDVFVHDRTSGMTNRVSISSDLEEAKGWSKWPSISGDGRLVAFVTGARNLVAGDSNRHDDVFVYDRAARKTTRVSVASDGTQGNLDSRVPMISADGSVVAFQSFADNLVGGDDSDNSDVFVHDLASGETERVSVGPPPMESNGASFTAAISADGRYVTFQSAATALVPDDRNSNPSRYDGIDVFLYDRTEGETERVSVTDDGEEANGSSRDPGVAPSITADGSYVCFASIATNVVDGDTNAAKDVFVRGPLR